MMMKSGLSIALFGTVVAMLAQDSVTPSVALKLTVNDTVHPTAIPIVAAKAIVAAPPSLLPSITSVPVVEAIPAATLSAKAPAAEAEPIKLNTGDATKEEINAAAATKIQATLRGFQARVPEISRTQGFPARRKDVETNRRKEPSIAKELKECFCNCLIVVGVIFFVFGMCTGVVAVATKYMKPPTAAAEATTNTATTTTSTNTDTNSQAGNTDTNTDTNTSRADTNNLTGN